MVLKLLTLMCSFGCCNVAAATLQQRPPCLYARALRAICFSFSTKAQYTAQKHSTPPSALTLLVFYVPHSCHEVWLAAYCCVTSANWSLENALTNSPHLHGTSRCASLHGATKPTVRNMHQQHASGMAQRQCSDSTYGVQVMQLGSKFQQLSVQKAAHVAHRVQPQYDRYLAVAQAHSKRLHATVADLEARADTTQKQKADGEAFRGWELCITVMQRCVTIPCYCMYPRPDPNQQAFLIIKIQILN